MNGYDVIGDLHGQDGKLESLLKTMGYMASGEGYVPPSGRQAVFVGDLIDRGDGQERVLKIVRAMSDSGHARAVMGNHEFNAIGYATPDPNARGGLECLRPNLGDHPKCIKNRKQHAAFLRAVGERSSTHMEWVEWFKTLPLFLDLDGIRVAHAWWEDDAVAMVNGADGAPDGAKMSEAFLLRAYEAGNPLKAARELLTTGIEWDLPAGMFIEDKEGNKHGNARLAVWRHDAERLREIALVPLDFEDRVPDIRIPPEIKLTRVTGAPILFGHHWFRGTPGVESPKVACLDWSAAAGGPLVAYRWDGESELSSDKLVAVGGRV